MVDSSVWFRRSQKTKGESKTSQYFLVMAFVHEQSCKCTKSELDLFSVPPTHTSMEQGSWVEYHPMTIVTDGSPIEFDISGMGEDYIDNANTMYVKSKVTLNNAAASFRKWTFRC